MILNCQVIINNVKVNGGQEFFDFIVHVCSSIITVALPSRSGPPAWGLGEVLTTPHCKNWPCNKMDTIASGPD